MSRESSLIAGLHQKKMKNSSEERNNKLFCYSGFEAQRKPTQGKQSHTIRRATMFITPFKSDIFYSLQNEDFQSEWAVLDALDSKACRVLTIASSGENALSILAHPKVGEVYAVDTNPAQRHLCILRQAALQHLSREEHLRLFAAQDQAHPTHGGEERIALLQAVEEHLPPQTRDYWNTRQQQDIAFGLNFVGRNDQLAMYIQQQLNAFGIHPLENALPEKDFQEFSSAFTQIYTAEFIKSMFDIEGDIAAQRISSQAVAIARCYFDALNKTNAANNYFLSAFFANRYAFSAGEDGMPGYLAPANYSLLKSKLQQHAPVWITQNLFAALQEFGSTQQFDLISVSNIPDWLDEAAYSTMMELALPCLRKGGAILARKATGGDSLEDLSRKLLHIDNNFNAQLLRTERAPMWKDIAAGFYY